MECILVTGIHACRPNMDNCRRGRADFGSGLCRTATSAGRVTLNYTSVRVRRFSRRPRRRKSQRSLYLAIVCARFCSNSRPLVLPISIQVGRSVELYGDGSSRRRATDRRAINISDSMLRQATLELSAVLSVRSDEAWPILETLYDLCEHGALQCPRWGCSDCFGARAHQLCRRGSVRW